MDYIFIRYMVTHTMFSFYQILNTKAKYEISSVAKTTALQTTQMRLIQTIKLKPYVGIEERN